MNRKPHLTVGIIGSCMTTARIAVHAAALGLNVVRISVSGERYEDLKAIKGLKAGVIIVDDIPEAAKPSDQFLIQALKNYEPPKAIMPVRYEPEREHWRRGRPLRKR
jgi:3-hydroxyacyl-CoA dehydrogenase